MARILSRWREYLKQNCIKNIKTFGVAMSKVERKVRFFAEVRNIPQSFHSADLRKHFADFVETSKFQCFHFRHRVQSIPDISIREPTRDLKLYCCLVKLKSEEFLNSFAKSYHMKPWTDRNEIELSDSYMCSIVIHHQDDETMPDTPELRPPAIMPRGNVGTPTKHFLKLIKSCQMPSGLIDKLGIDFTKIRGRRKYGNVFFDYGPPHVRSVQPKLAASLRSSAMPSASIVTPKPTKLPDDELEDEDEDGGEEWERHESLHENVTEQGRTNQRLYEEDMEVVWEKGGSGLVFYTDAVEWDKAAGDFDEKTADDWDVDMEGYYVPGGGDKDAKDLLTIRQDELDREGKTSSVFKKPQPRNRHSQRENVSSKSLHRFPTGAFDSRGVVKNMMRKHGWRIGQSLGRSQPGIKEPIEADGQKYYDKSGFGYHGEALVRTVKRKPIRSVRDDDDIIISTVYDDPSETDPEPQPLVRSTPETQLKHRKDFAWKHNPFVLL